MRLAVGRGARGGPRHGVGPRDPDPSSGSELRVGCWSRKAPGTYGSSSGVHRHDKTLRTAKASSGSTAAAPVL